MSSIAVDSLMSPGGCESALADQLAAAAGADNHDAAFRRFARDLIGADSENEGDRCAVGLTVETSVEVGNKHPSSLSNSTGFYSDYSSTSSSSSSASAGGVTLPTSFSVGSSVADRLRPEPEVECCGVVMRRPQFGQLEAVASQSDFELFPSRNALEVPVPAFVTSLSSSRDGVANDDGGSRGRLVRSDWFNTAVDDDQTASNDEIVAEQTTTAVDNW